ncbi:MAG: TonB-dependent receptor plug domain-containing protein [Bacteroidia bacterium]|nr:TonB-dependent receptor plug domain-containing protein [Bacteroidia bacterium]
MRKALTIFVAMLLSLAASAQPSGTVKDGMKAVSERYGVFFAYDSNLPVDMRSPVQDFKGKSLHRSLRALFAGTGIDWKVKGKYVLLTASVPVEPLETFAVYAEPGTQMDTIVPSVISSRRDIEHALGKISSDMADIRGIVSPLGEGDPVKWVQSLPGVTTGADGSSAFYVRGGNISNNKYSLDGVPVYAYSHLLWLTTVVPPEVIGRASLQKSGFDGGESNFTAAHLRLSSKVPEEGTRTRFALNNFLVSASGDGKPGRFSYLFSARVSPLTYEYNLFHKALPNMVGDMKNFKAGVGDIYVKLRFDIAADTWMEASGLGSRDSYSFTWNAGDKDQLGWANGIGMVKFHTSGSRTSFDATASVNNYVSEQEQDKLYRTVRNRLSLQSSLLEYGLQAELRHHPDNERFALSEGLNVRFARFAPGQRNEENERVNTILATGWFQAEYTVPDLLQLKSMVRADVFHGDNTRFDPEFSLSAKYELRHNLDVEASVDRLVQYYHTLEGLPLGWSLDMMVPTGDKLLPEASWQADAGLSGHYGPHDFSLGGFYKRMENLIFYKYSQVLFNGALSDWKNHIELGNGRAFGLEAFYEYSRNDWDIRASYTLSKALREDFPSLYDGGRFHARFDRTHALNATAGWKGLSATLVLQSGYWENGAGESYELSIPGISPLNAMYFTGVNNYHMPPLFRLDLGYRFSFNTRNARNEVNIGVCNLTNHFNTSLIIYDSRNESWNELALLPILPNFRYQIEF